MKKSKNTNLQASELQSKRTTLLKLIQKFRNFQPVYMPGLISHLNEIGWKEAGTDLQQPETMVLWLPSAFPDDAARAKVCSQNLCAIEAELRYAQLIEALSNLRQQLRQRVYAGKLKTKNGSGQAYYLRSNTFLSQVEGRIRAHRAQYDSARSALLNLRAEGDWSEMYQELKAEDIRRISENAAILEETEELKRTRALIGLPAEPRQSDEDDMEVELPVAPPNPRAALGEGKRVLSWIWYTISKNELGEDDSTVERSE
jgi:hypothetical protein